MTEHGGPVVRILTGRTMGRAPTTFGALVACVLAVAPARAQESVTIENLRWIAGSWTAAAGLLTVEEHWTQPATNGMLAVGRTLSGQRMVSFEYLRIEERDDGIFYVAHPGGRPLTEFRLTRWDGRTVVFENPDHDFPKRILYTRNDDGSMTARVDAGEGVKEGAREITYHRVGLGP